MTAAPPNTYPTSATDLDLQPKRKEIPLSETARVVAEKRNLRTDENGKVVETVYDMFKRVADNIASGDKLYGATDEQVAQVAQDF